VALLTVEHELAAVKQQLAALQSNIDAAEKRRDELRAKGDTDWKLDHEEVKQLREKVAQLREEAKELRAASRQSGMPSHTSAVSAQTDPGSSDPRLTRLLLWRFPLTTQTRLLCSLNDCSSCNWRTSSAESRRAIGDFHLVRRGEYEKNHVHAGCSRALLP